MKLDDIAMRIAAHLRRIESDPIWNAPREWDPIVKRMVLGKGNGLRPYWNTHASRSGSRVRVTYVSYQGSRCLTRDEALAYLAWLDAGNVGTHHNAKAGA